MEWKMNPNAINQYSKGSKIYQLGDAVSSIAMIIKGRVQIQNDSSRVVVGSGNFLGMHDLYAGRYQSAYVAYEDAMLYMFPIERKEDLEQILSMNNEYHGLMVATLYRMIYELDLIYQEMIKNSSEIYQFITEQYQYYIQAASRRGYKLKQPARFMKLAMPDSDMELIRNTIDYYKECRNLPVEVVKAFYSYGNMLSLYQIEEQAGIINGQQEILSDLLTDLITLVECLVDDSDTCLFRLFAEFALEITNSEGNNQEMMDIMDGIIDEINKFLKFSEQKLGYKYEIDRKRMEEVYHLLITGTKNTEMSTEAYLKYPRDLSERAVEEAENSFITILSYAGIKEERMQQMQSVLLDFLNLKDKSSTEDHARVVRRQLADAFYELYKEVFLRAYQDGNVPKIVDMFLKYGYADERLLTKEQYLSLYFMEEEKTDGPCNVYNIKEWLILIYEGKKMPSKNEFDQEYPEWVQSLRNQQGFTQAKEKEWMESSDKKLEFEIQNMFRYNNRITNGSLGTFVPILYKDVFMHQPDKIRITARMINDTLGDIMQIDYSAFDREVLYMNKEKNISKEYIIRRIFPDIVLMPTIGANGVMWQEITGKRRDSAGRFFLPIFSENNLYHMLVRLLGKYRWELCRTLEGTAWNDIKHKSLTSEYVDYIQFYRKNRELTEEKKEKIKKQIQRGRNSSREIFVLDYEQWINYEAKGILKLNKLVRELLATYCPFSKKIREQLKSQALFDEAMLRYHREKQKKVREVEARYRNLQKDQIELTPELIATLNYYKEL